MNPPLVSIIVPVYNSEKTISKCLDSLISQTFKDIEIICVNDCSRDNSLQVLYDYASKDSRIVVINHKENMNAGGARNSGIRSAKGEYICFVDNDDWMTSNAIETLIAESEDCTIDLVVCQWCKYYDENRKSNMKNLIVEGSDKENKVFALLHGCRILGCLFKKDIFYKNDLFFPERSFWEDNAIAMSLIFSAERIKVIDKVLYYYQMLQESSSRSITMPKIKDRIKTSDLAVANLERLGFVNNENKPLVDYLYLCFSYHTIKQLELIGNSEAKCQLRIVADKIRPLLPNSYLSEYRKEYVNTLTHPIAYYYFGILKLSIKSLLYPCYKAIRSLMSK